MNAWPTSFNFNTSVDHGRDFDQIDPVHLPSPDATTSPPAVLTNQTISEGPLRVKTGGSEALINPQARAYTPQYDGFLQLTTPAYATTAPIFASITYEQTMQLHDPTLMGRNEFYTSVCGAYSPEIRAPVKKATRPGKSFSYHCPRCDTQFSRRYTVKQHFTGCIARYGNPHSLRWIDHPSLMNTSNYSPRAHNPWNKRREDYVRPAYTAYME